MVVIASMLSLGAIISGEARAQAESPSPSPPATRRSLATALEARQPNTRLVSSLDVWIVQRFRGAQLLEDTVSALPSIADAAMARIESTRIGGEIDTLFALHFTSRPRTAALETGATVRLAGPTGTVSPIAARVLARRQFRAPRAPSANNSDDSDWRYGWAYLIALPKAGRSTPATTFRGWLLIESRTPR